MRHRSSLLALLFLTLLLVLALPGGADAQSNRRWNWQRWDVEINNIDTRANRFHVIETHVITVTSGSFAGGDRGVSLERVTSIGNVTVADGTTPLRLVNANSSSTCPTTGGIFCVFTKSNNERDIWYNFVRRATSGETRTIRIEYDVNGALRSYAGGDQLWWSPLASTRAFPVLASRVVVKLPPDRPAQNVAAYGSFTYRVEGTTVAFDSTGRISENELAEIRVQYPHDPAMAAPAWQATFDRQRELEERLGPIIPVVMLVLTGLLGLGGPLLIYIQYSTHGRDPEPIAVPEYLTEPPSEQPPGIVGTLIDETADMEDIMGTLLDLARRGYIVIEQEENKFLIFSSQEFTFHLSNTPAPDDPGLRPYERALLDGIFRRGKTVKLSDLRNKFYTTIPVIKTNLYKEVVSAGFFKRSPELTRNIWGGIGVFLLIVAGVGFFFLLVNPSKRLPNIPLLPLPFLGLGVLAVVMLLVSRFMPAKTLAGSQEATKWRAFRRYLANINKYTDVQQAADQFERYIGYAIAFGLADKWVRSFAPVLTSMPSWYYPTYLGGPWHGGYRGYRQGGYSGEMLGQPGGAFSGGGFSGSGGLNSMSDNLTQGLNAMSSGLTSLLNSASSAMTSHPSSSGGGFSGGGGGGGGSSGGGSAGGH